ncbi:MAG: fused MFS/spermidine synthase [Gammaproteobacteria bacterium]|jgi:predicted membrane-bound spermidine synthase|nr:fused MFS/spermidine synthase [Gammaproteobacteria bacterium]
MKANRLPVYLLLFLTFTEGSAVMIAELTGARMLAPLYGSTLHVWGAVIGVTLLSLTGGYWLGGVLSRRKRRIDMLCGFLLLAALLIIAMPTLAHWLMLRFEHLAPLPAILIQIGIYMAPALLLLGASPPLIIAVLAERPEEAGRMAGTVFAVSTIGGVLATFIGGFWLLPELGLTRTAALAGLALGFAPLAILLMRRRWMALAVPALAGLLLWPSAPAPMKPGASIVYQSEGLLGQIKVIDVPARTPPGAAPRTDRILFVNRMAQTWMDRDSGTSMWGYVNYLRAIGSLLPEGSRVLMLGLGGGIVARDMQQLGHVVDSVELDARIVDVAQQHFGLRPNGETRVDDGRHYLRSTERRYDLIILDVYQAEIPPGHMLTVEAFTDMQRALKPGGFFVINYPGFLTGSIGFGGRSIYRTLLEAGYQVRLLPTGRDESSGNNLYIAATQALDFSRPRVPLRRFDGVPLALETLFLDPETIDLNAAMVLRDNRPMLEKVSLEAAANWREGYSRHFTRPFLELGIPLFE